MTINEEIDWKYEIEDTIEDYNNGKKLKITWTPSTNNNSVLCGILSIKRKKYPFKADFSQYNGTAFDFYNENGQLEDFDDFLMRTVW